MFGAAGRIANSAPSSGGSPESKLFTVTEASWTFSFGFDLDQPAGSRSPSTFDSGKVLSAAYYFSLGPVFTIAIDGNHPQSLVESVSPQDGGTLNEPGDITGFNYDAVDDRTEWSFSAGSIPARWNGSGTSTVNISLR